MGCGSSGASTKSGGARLMTTKLTFAREQLDNLNGFFRQSIERDVNDNHGKIKIPHFLLFFFQE